MTQRRLTRLEPKNVPVCHLNGNIFCGITTAKFEHPSHLAKLQYFTKLDFKGLNHHLRWGTEERTDVIQIHGMSCFIKKGSCDLHAIWFAENLFNGVSLTKWHPLVLETCAIYFWIAVMTVMLCLKQRSPVHFFSTNCFMVARSNNLYSPEPDTYTR